MKFIMICSLLAGSAFAAHHNPNHISGRERLALATSSPPVHVAADHHRNKKGRTEQDRVVTNKTTITAFVPYGK